MELKFYQVWRQFANILVTFNITRLGLLIDFLHFSTLKCRIFIFNTKMSEISVASKWSMLPIILKIHSNLILLWINAGSLLAHAFPCTCEYFYQQLLAFFRNVFGTWLVSNCWTRKCLNHSTTARTRVYDCSLRSSEWENSAALGARPKKQRKLKLITIVAIWNAADRRTRRNCKCVEEKYRPRFSAGIIGARLIATK